jgi:hypothetical protein
LRKFCHESKNCYLNDQRMKTANGYENFIIR